MVVTKYNEITINDTDYKWLRYMYITIFLFPIDDNVDFCLLKDQL